jgi:hypothetical protein
MSPYEILFTSCAARRQSDRALVQPLGTLSRLRARREAVDRCWLLRQERRKF